MPSRNLKVIVFPPVTFHDVASLGSAFCVRRFTRIKTPRVKYWMVSVESSSTSKGLKVFGSDAMQNRSSDCAAKGRLTRSEKSSPRTNSERCFIDVTPVQLGHLLRRQPLDLTTGCCNPRHGRFVCD